MPRINLSNVLNPHHAGLFQSTAREVVFYGGAGAGKTYSVADKLLLQPLIHRKPIRAMVIRKSLPSLKRSVLPVILKRAAAMGIPAELNRVDLVLHLPYGSEIMCVSIGNYGEVDKIKSITDLDFAWIEEASEITPAAYDEIKRRLRGGESPYKQAILTLNPVGTTSWVYDRFFTRPTEAEKIHTTVRDNPYIDAEYVRALEALKDTSPAQYAIYCKGEWGTPEGVILSNWTTVPTLPGNITETIYGLDFGFNNPTALVAVHLADGVPYLEELVYQTGLTNSDLIAVLQTMSINATIYADSAEPDRIEELRRAGFKVHAANKTVPVKVQLDYLQRMKLHVTADSTNLIKELQSYSWERDAAGNPTDAPVKWMDHAIDAARYAIYTHTAKHFTPRMIGANGAR